MIIDLFAGPGGWDVGAAMLCAAKGYERALENVVGLEWDAAACKTAKAAGHERIRCDVATYPTDAFGRVEGLIASPPCQAWSMAGKRKGELDRANCHALADRMAGGDDSTDWTAWEDDKSPLVCQPVRWVRDLRPEWVALEEVPAVASLWEHFARIFRDWGYSVWTGDLCAADYGMIYVCPLHDKRPPTSHADSAENLSRYVTDQASAARAATTSPDEALAPLVATVAARLDRAIRPAFAGSATCDERARRLEVLAASAAQTTPCGTAVASWTTEATSRYGLTLDTVASIASLLSNCLAEPSLALKWSTTSTKTQQTIVHQTSRSIAATLITGCGTGPATREAGCGLCHDLGVPQTRTRRILMASRTMTVQPPEPTHSEFPQAGADLFGGQLAGWVSMATALGWGFDQEPSCTVTGGGTEAGGAEPFGNAGYRKRLTAFVSAGVTGEGRPKDPQTQPADTLTGKGTAYWTTQKPAPTITTTRRSKDGMLVGRQLPPGEGENVGGRNWLRMTTMPNSAVRHVSEPAPTIAFGHDSASAQWIFERPATTVVGSFCPDVISAPGYRTQVSRQNAEGGVRVTVAEGGVLQSFPADYPWQGSRTKQYQQVGNAIPPRLAMHVLAALGVGDMTKAVAA